MKENFSVNLSNVDSKIQNQISSFLEKIKKYPHFSDIEPRMKIAEENIGYKFNNLSFLTLAFCRTKIDSGNNNYENESLAQVGDKVLDLVIFEYGFSEGKEKSEIDTLRQKHAGNKKLFEITKKKDLKRFCYHQEHFSCDDNIPEHKKVSANQHDSVVEAIIGAIYLDSGLDKAREWIYKNVIDHD